MHDLVATEIEPFAQARLLERGPSEIAVHAIDDRAKLEDERASHEISTGKAPGEARPSQDQETTETWFGEIDVRTRSFERKVPSGWALKKRSEPVRSAVVSEAQVCIPPRHGGRRHRGSASPAGSGNDRIP